MVETIIQQSPLYKDTNEDEKKIINDSIESALYMYAYLEIKLLFLDFPSEYFLFVHCLHINKNSQHA